MESSETLPQPGQGKIEPITALQFEVVRRAEFVFEPFLGSLIQLPEVRMQRAQSSEFFLAQASTNPQKDQVEAPLVWERPRPVAQSAAPPTHIPTEHRPPMPADMRKAKLQKPPKDQEAPRFYQPPIVRFFDPVAAAAEDGEEVDAPLPEPRASTQLSPELKAAILRIDEQRRQMQQDAKQEKPTKGKKRGLLKAKSANAAGNSDVPIEIVKSREVELTERAARWEEIAIPPTRSAKREEQQPAAHIDQAPAVTTSATDDVERVEAVSPAIAPALKMPPIPAAEPAQPVASSLEINPAQEAISIDAALASSHPAQQQEMITAIAQEAAAANQIAAMPEFNQIHDSLGETEAPSHEEADSAFNATPLDTLPAPYPQATLADAPQEISAAAEFIPASEFSSTHEDLSESEIVELHEVASAPEDIPADSAVAPPLATQRAETIPAPGHEAIPEEVFVSSLEFALSEEDLHEAAHPTMPEAALPLPPAVAMPSSSVAYVAEPAPIPPAPPALVKENHPLPLTFESDAPITKPVEDATAEPLSTKRRRGIAAAISRLRRADLVQEKIETSIFEGPFEEESIDEAELPRQKEKLPLAMRLQRWLGGESPKLDGNRRRAERTIMPGLVAFYWSGGSPKPHEIVNISKTGFYVKTTEFWSVETLVRMTLQRPASETKRKSESISVLARVVRIDEDGVGHEFVTTEALIHARSMDVMPSHGTDTRALDKFLQIQ
ncbi:PilZ domain-containing protein [Telmatobacter sp. DSM 110680]|uniref:PilZ domain-containing protein n=1 Tax=Telmatobacter sp. DSM 110680 TaxID=3036704 RepID=A0AAU7DHJ1_9BACT